jgi:hypothetical protein
LDQWLQEHLAPKAKITLHMRITNVGPIYVDLLTVTTHFQYRGSPWEFYGPTAQDVHGMELTFPVQLPPHGVQLSDLEATMLPTSWRNHAEFAAALSHIDAESPGQLDVEITAKTLDEAGKTKSFKLKYKIATRPLKDLYLEHWQAWGSKNLLRLAVRGDRSAQPSQSSSQNPSALLPPPSGASS